MTLGLIIFTLLSLTIMFLLAFLALLTRQNEQLKRELQKHQEQQGLLSNYQLQKKQ